jgi:hypothetical protein
MNISKSELLIGIIGIMTGLAIGFFAGQEYQRYRMEKSIAEFSKQLGQVFSKAQPVSPVSKEIVGGLTEQDLKREVEQIAEKIRAAHLNKDINKWLNCYSSAYPNLGHLENRMLELWKNYDIKEVNYRISNIQRLSDTQMAADIVWNIQVFDQRTRDYTLVRTAFKTILEKAQDSWKIRDSKEEGG